MISGATTAALADAPEQIEGVLEVNAEEVIDLADQHGGLVVIDARITDDRAMGHIQGSLSLPDISTDCRSLKELAPDPAAPILFYCNGIKCGRSAKSALIAQGCGYQAIYWFRGGFEEWKAKDYPYLVE